MYKIAIPTFKRLDTFKTKTLSYLKKTNIDINNIYLFVANEEEKLIYKETGLKNIIVGIEGIRNQRNFIRHYFNEGEKIFNMDDDIEGLYYAPSEKKYELLLDLNKLIIDGFKYCDKAKTKLWGINAVRNPLFMFNKKVSINLRYIVGATFGQIIDYDNKLAQTIDDKGDYERSILYFIKFGSIVRINNISVYTNYYKTKGGMQETRTKERVKASGLYLLNKYPSYCIINKNKKNKEFFEIKLKYESKGNSIK